MKIRFTLFLLLVAVSVCNAQDIEIRGRIVEFADKKLTPFGFANVTLQHEDSTVITGVASSENGHFSIKNIHKGDFIIKVSFLGYNDAYLNLKNLQQSVDVGDILIQTYPLTLDEVVVTASSIIQHIDRKVILPPKDDVRRSSNTYDLLSRLMINRLHVDPIKKKLNVSGGRTVQTRINGIQISPEEFSAINPADILRIEYIEDPGSRYNDNSLGAIINVITRRREAGGFVSFQLGNSPHMLYGENFLTAKFNYKKSEWGLTVNNQNRRFKKGRKDFTEKFFLENGNVIERTQEGINAKTEFFINNINLSYNLYEPDKYTFNAIFYNRIFNQPHQNTFSKQYGNNSTDFIYSEILKHNSSYSPSLDIYYSHTLPHKQNIELNLVGTIIDTKNNRSFREFTPGNVDLNSFITNIKGKKYSIIGEAIYEKEFENIKISTGARHFQMRAENKYTGSNPIDSDMNQAESYAFAELQGRVGPFSYAGGVGMTRSWFKEGEKDNTKYTFSPMARLSYSPHDNLFFRYNFSINPSIPGLGSLTDVEQAQDTIQIIRGNPMLKTYKMISNNINISYNNDFWSSDIDIRYDYYDKPIMESIFSENNKMIFMDENQRSYQRFNVEGNFAIKGIDIGSLKNFISANVRAGYSYFNSKGHTYEHDYNNLYCIATLYLNYKNVSLSGQYRRDQYRLFGETIQKGENTNYVGISYKKGNLSADALMLFPFSNTYKTGYERLSKVAPNVGWAHLDDIGQMVLLRLSYNFNFGRKYKSKEKRINNADTDAGIINL